MDPISRGSREHVASKATGVAPQEMDRCLLSLCQNVFSKCRSNHCKDKKIKPIARVGCESTRLVALQEAQISCTQSCSKVAAARAKQEGRIADDIDLQMCMTECMGMEVLKNPKYKACLTEATVTALGDCMVANCATELQACAKSRCKLSVVLS